MSSDKRILNYGDDIAQHRSSEWKYSFRVYYKRRPRRWQSLCWWVRSVKTRELVPHCSCRRNVFNSGQITFQQSYLSARCRAPTKTLSSALAPMTKDDESLLHRRGGGDLISARALPETNKKFRDEVIIFLSLFVADNGWRTPREWLKPLNHLIDLWGGGGWIHHVFFWLLGNENNGTRHPIQLFISLVQVPTEISSKSPNTSETKVTTKRHGKAFYTWASPLDESH